MTTNDMGVIMNSNQHLLDEAQTIYNDLVDGVMLDEPLRKEMIQVLHKLMSRIQKLSTPSDGEIVAVMKPT